IAREIASPRVATSAVRAQYEEHPYPRWFSLDRVSGDAHEPARRLLFAGCGTGADAIRRAMQHPSWQIEAIDVSVRSLAYAIRMARHYGIANIRFTHADLRDVDGTFDVVESIGVLHHLDDPLAGLRALAARSRGELT